jgi:G patch domain-containing protein 1
MKITTEKPPPPLAPAIVEVPRTVPAVAKAALMGFQPFQQDPVKQTRYTVYLHLQAAEDQTLPPQLQPLAKQTTEEFNFELQSFAKAAQIFKPMSVAMASRFKSSTINEGLPDVQEGLYQPPADAYQEEEEEKETREKKAVVEESPKEHAARMGIFGKLTREEKPWLPAKLLCKRFGVKVPDVVLDDPANQMGIDERPTAAPLLGDGDVLAIPNYDHNVSAGNAEPVRAIAASDVASMGKGRRDLNNVGLGEDTDQGKDILTYERPTMDIFKAIFASDEEDSGVSDDEGKPDSITVAKEDAPQSSNLASAFAPKLPPASTFTSGDAPQSKEDTTMDLSSFRPTFVSKNQREGAKAKSSKPDTTKKKTSKVLVSFGVDEDETGGLTVIPSVKKRKREKERGGGEDEKSKSKKKKREKREKGDITVSTDVGVDDDDMWVEKPVNLPPSGMDLDNQTNAGSVQTLNTSRRPKAVDFL